MRKVIDKHAVSEGIGIGKAFIYKTFEPNIIDIKIEPQTIDEHISKFITVRDKATEEITALYETLKHTNKTQADILNAQLGLIGDISIYDEVVRVIKEELYDVSKAINYSFEMFVELFLMSGDDLLKERASDLKDVKLRMLRVLENKKEVNLSVVSEESIVIAHDLFPSDTALMDKNNIKGIITEIGGVTSHTAIIAKTYDIPAILGVTDFLNSIAEGETIILDGINGKIIINPTNDELKHYELKQEKYLMEQNELSKYLDEKSLTKDNQKIEIHLNIGSASDFELEAESYVDGVGLFRSEFLFMESADFPSEEYQFKAYKKVVEKFKDKPVILRTLDIGGDKSLPYLTMPKEDNPFLGNRAVRLSFEHVEMFKTQIKAALRAAKYGNLHLMIPMIASMDDIYQTKEIIEISKKELKKENISYGEIKFGVMIEVPSLVFIADKVAEAVDFASIGTNDLCQYLTAVDRLNPYVEKYYQNHSPALFKAVQMCSKAFIKANKPLSVCGELGGDLYGAAVLIGLGIHKLSMSKSKIAEIKKMIQSFELKEFETMASKVVLMDTEADVLTYLKNKIK